MIHYSCDMCKCELDPKHDSSYVVRMEVYPAPAESSETIVEDRDHLGDINEVLERYEEFEPDGQLPESDTYQSRRFDLCGECCKRFLREPLGRSAAPHFNFSKR